MTDGSDITNEISSDFGEIIVNKQIKELNKYLAQLGTDFNTMRDWMKKKYDIWNMTYDTDKWIYVNDLNVDIRFPQLVRVCNAYLYLNILVAKATSIAVRSEYYG